MARISMEWQARLGALPLGSIVLGMALAGLVLLPMMWLLTYAATDETGNLSWNNFIYIATNSEFLKPFISTISLAIWVTLGSCVLAVPLAWAVTLTDIPFPRVIRILVIASFATPPFLGAIAWELLASPNTGLFNVLLRSALHLDPASFIFNIYSMTGVVFVMTCYAFPYVFVILSNALEAIPSELEEASAILGAHPWHTLSRVVLPVVMPALAAGAAISFIQAMTQFGTPAILGLPAHVLVVTTLILSYFQYPPQLHLAAASSLPILLLTILVLWMQRRMLGRRGFALIGGKAGQRRRLRLRGWRWPVGAAALLILAVVVVAPNLVILKLSISRTISDLFAPGNTSFEHFPYVFTDLPQTLPALRSTLITSILAAFCAIVLAIAVAYTTTRSVTRLAPALGWLAMAPVAIPGIVLGVALFLSYTRAPLQLYGTLWIIVLAFVTVELPAAYQMIQAAFRGLHRELEEASRIMGATVLRSIAGITLPLLAPSVIAAWCFVFIGGVRELSAAVLLSTANTKLISVLIYNLNDSADYTSVAVLGVTITLLTVLVVGVATALGRLGHLPPRLP